MTSAHTLILFWFVAYALPMAGAGAFALFVPLKTETKDEWVKINTIAIHIALLVSIILSHIAIHSLGLNFPWTLDSLSALLLAISVLVAIQCIGKFGFVYTISAFIQELAMMSVAFLLFPAFPLWTVILLIVPIFAVCHLLSLKNWKLRLLLVTLWGITSLLIFYTTKNIYLVTTLHAALGALLAKSVLPTWTNPTPQKPPFPDKITEK